MSNRTLLSAAGAVAFLLLWHLAASLQLVDPLLLPSPIDVFGLFLEPQTLGRLAGDGLSTFYRAMSGFAIGALAGVVAGMVLGWSKPIYAVFEFLIEFFRSLPAAALLPPFMLFFGLGDLSKISLVAFSCALVVLVHTASGVKSRNQTRSMVAGILGATRLQLLTKVILPEVLPSIATGLRISVSLALIVTIVAEMLVSTANGLGRTILDAQLLFQTAEMYAAIIVAGVLGYAVNRLIVTVSERLIHWEGK